MRKRYPIRTPKKDRYDPYDSDCYAAINKKDLIYSGYVDDRLVVFLWDNLLKAGIRLDKDNGGAGKEGRRLIINSSGGDVYCMNSIVDLFEQIDDLTIVANGACMSAAVPIVAAGTPGMRYATHRTRFMLHPGYEDMDCALKLIDFEAMRDELETTEDIYARILYRYTTPTLKWWIKQGKEQKDWYFDAKKALELGIIDHIIPDPIRGKVKK